MSRSPEDLFRRHGEHPLHHFTDNQNLESIKEHGLLSLLALGEMGFDVPRPGGNDWSHNEDCRRGLDRYVHLSLTKGHPMCYHAEKEGRIGPVTDLLISHEVFLLEGVRFTLDVSNKKGVELLPFGEWYSAVDLDVLYKRMDWKDPKVKERLQQSSRAEILVPDQVPVNLIVGGL